MTTATDITVPLLDLKAQYDTIRDEIEPVMREVVESQWFIGGPHVSGLEEECAAYCQATHCSDLYLLLNRRQRVTGWSNSRLCRY